VVTGHDAGGKAVFVSDEMVPPIIPTLLPGNEFHRLWGGDEAPHFPDDGSRPDDRSYFPPVGGFRFGIFTIPPDGGAGAPPGLDMTAALADLEEKLPGLAGHMEVDNPGMHTTATIDFEVVLSGTVTLELDDGATVSVGPGDTVVQNGTRHRWSNPGTEPAVLAVFICGAHHDHVG
jgi:mannose-6-phosphate isomerase-like protein (cupin superfamily)